MVPLGFLSTTSAGACTVALFSLAVHRPFRCVAWVGGAEIALIPLLAWARPDPTLSYVPAVAWSVLFTVTAIGWGMFVRSKRQLMLSLRDRARRAETEARLRAEQAQRLAREAIARVHAEQGQPVGEHVVHLAGGLEFRPDAPREEIAR
ncbi:sensor histidine kinase, partial [Streptomyces sp. MBT49]|nr:sensor histidine kinase [Streptomyces sp. MBT49]